MINVEVLRNSIEQYGRENNIKGFSNMIVELAMDSKITYQNLYKILRNKTCNLSSLIALCNTLCLEPNDLIILDDMDR